MNSFRASLWSKEYLSAAGAEDTLTVQIEQRLWRLLVEQGFEGRIFIRIHSEEKSWIAPIGPPVQDLFSSFEDNENNGNSYYIFVPTWMLDTAGFQGVGEGVHLEVMDNRDFEKATRIVLRVVDSRFYNDSDIKSRLEEVLSRLGVIRKGSLLQVPCSAGVADVFISGTEPSEYVLCDGEEVAVEFEEPVDAVPAPPPRPLTPPPPPQELGRLLVGTDGEAAVMGGSAAFSGQGNRLGSSNAVAPPPWRVGLQRIRGGAGESKLA